MGVESSQFFFRVSEGHSALYCVCLKIGAVTTYGINEIKSRWQIFLNCDILTAKFCFAC